MALQQSRGGTWSPWVSVSGNNVPKVASRLAIVSLITMIALSLNGSILAANAGTNSVALEEAAQDTNRPSGHFWSAVVSGAQDTLELRGTVLSDCGGIPECCITQFCLHACPVLDLIFLDSGSIDLSLLYGQDVRLRGVFLQCGFQGCWDVFNVIEAVLETCPATPVIPSSWGRLKRAFYQQ